MFYLMAGREFAGRGGSVLETRVGGAGGRATEQSWPSRSNRVVSEGVVNVHILNTRLFN